MLTLRDLTVRFPGPDGPGPGAAAVDRVTLDLPDGEVLAVLGPSGCGKSTLLRAIAGLEQLAGGSIAWDGRDQAGVPTHRRGFALMFQDGQLFDHLTVARNVGYALRLRRAPDTARQVAELLDLVGLPSYGDRMPGTLSGGERQRVALARSLAVGPRLLLLDEPLSALDTGLRERLAGDLGRILREAGTTALLVTHDHEEAFAVADRLAVMRAGRIVQQGDISEVWRAPVDPATALFLGYARVLSGEHAERLLAVLGLDPGPAVALRRSALVVDDRGPLAGTVVSSRLTPEQVRLEVDVPGAGRLDAVSPLDHHPATGDRVGLRIERTRLALVSPPELRKPPLD